MFLISDKLEKSTVDYEPVLDEKRDLTKDEENAIVVKKSHRSYVLYTILLGMVFTILMWTMLPPNRFNNSQIMEVESEILGTTFAVVNETRSILVKIAEGTYALSQKNQEMADEYIAIIRDILKDRTKFGVLKINNIVLEKMRFIENELVSFDYVITEAADGIMEYLKNDMVDVKEFILTIDSGDAEESLTATFEKVEKKIESAFLDLDSMYTFYSGYLGDIIGKRIQNATDQISIMLNSNRKRCDCSILQRINSCYNISVQNGEISRKLESAMKVYSIITNTLDVLDELESTFEESNNEHLKNMFTESRNVLNKTLQNSKHMIESMLNEDSYFLGSWIQKRAFEDYNRVKSFILKAYETSIEGLARNFNQTVIGYEIVQIKHWNDIKSASFPLLKYIEDAVKEKAMLINSKEKRDEFLEKAEFNDLKTWMENKHRNATEVVNAQFQSRMTDIATVLRYTLQYIDDSHLSFISQLSVQNYLPSDVCPLSLYFQEYAGKIISEFWEDPKTIETVSEATNYIDDGVKNDEGQQSEKGQEVKNEITDTAGIQLNDRPATEVDNSMIEEVLNTIRTNYENGDIDGYVIELPISVLYSISDEDVSGDSQQFSKDETAKPKESNILDSSLAEEVKSLVKNFENFFEKSAEAQEVDTQLQYPITEAHSS